MHSQPHLESPVRLRTGNTAGQTGPCGIPTDLPSGAISFGAWHPVDKAWKSHPLFLRAKRVVVSVFGGSALLLGIALLVLPGPAFLVIPAGLGILALEFRWARRWLKKMESLLPGSPHY